MTFEKKILAEMPKCYALGMFEGEDTPSFLAAVEMVSLWRLLLQALAAS